MSNAIINVLRKSTAAIAVAVALAMSLSSCGFVNFVLKYSLDDKRNEESETVDSENENRLPVEQGSREEITISKAESNKNEHDQVTSAGQAYNSVSEVYYAVADCVVEITTEIVQNSGWMGQYVSKGAGSGVIIDKSGLVVTNNHVIEGARQVTVRLTDGSEYSATLMGTDAAADLAVLKIDVAGKSLSAAKLGCSADLVVGEDVVAIGNPLGSLGGTLTTGIISATERNIIIDGEEMVLLQTNAAINPGNSGGGLFNMAGELIGVVNAKAAGEDVEGLGFAIPIDFAHKIIEDLVNYGYVRDVVDHGLVMLDVTTQNLPFAYQKYGITTTGVVIVESEYTKELKHGDVIIAINGASINTSNDVNIAVKAYSVGETVSVTVKRGDKTVNVSLVLHEKKPETVDFGR